MFDVKKSLFVVSLITMGCLYGMLAAVIILICILCDVNLNFAIIFSIIIIMLQFLISPWLTDIVMRWFYKVDFKYQIHDYLKTFIDDICKANNMKYPKIGFINDGSPYNFLK